MADSKPKRRHKTTPPPLSLREIRFCRHYAEHGDASAAYRAAGYPDRPAPSTWTLAWKVLRKVEVRAYIQKLRTDAAEAAGVSVDWVVRGLKDIADDKKLKAASRVAAFRLLAQWLKMIGADPEKEAAAANAGKALVVVVEPDTEPPAE